ncbi:CehA/McbA family metallohydrolase [Aurantimonas sp. MSK8Z-1]|uniref:CehA/McbA family metallohydrolase n=1 Tax=Mangrovibrevibacter kandeliae TaxID=2968473 RepID=UPI00211760A8|nr:CehA/McbA family metallohydrolase [Aurantimonas sp. MSK8Z-1]MCW4114031.1 CehA/McbA family metallohydrolase [Aurantimonas sp. MSK8Z-1]
MTLAAFTRDGRFLRGNIHTHSTRSDGALAPDEVARTYAEAGYDFLCLSDHFLPAYGFPIVDTTPYRTNRFTTIMGAEVHAPANSHGEAWHILAAGLPLDFEPTGEGESGVDLARRCAEAGAFVGIAHPQWSGLTIEDGRALAAIAHAVEIYNYTCDIECARPDGTYLLDQLLNDGHRLNAYAADDAHFRWADACGGWMMVKAGANEPEAILAAMREGAFYSSTGPLIHSIAVDGDDVEVECSPAASVAILGRGTRAETVQARQTSRARLPLERFAGDWFRIVVRDAAGKHAWSNPVWLD